MKKRLALLLAVIMLVSLVGGGLSAFADENADPTEEIVQDQPAENTGDTVKDDAVEQTENLQQTTEDKQDTLSDETMDEMAALNAGISLLDAGDDTPANVSPSGYDYTGTVGSANYKSIMGDGVYYGFIADELTASANVYTNLAVKEVCSATNGIGASFYGSGEVCYIGQVDNVLKLDNMGKDGKAATIYTPEDKSKFNNDNSGNGISYVYMSKDDVNAKVDSLRNSATSGMNAAIAQAAGNYGAIPSDKLENNGYYTQNCYVLDLSAEDPNGTFYFDYDAWLASPGAGTAIRSNGLCINKHGNQTVVFVSQSSDVPIYRYKVNNTGTGKDNQGDYSAPTEKSAFAKDVAQTVFFLCPNATSVHYTDSPIACGIVAPNATVSVGGTGAGWVVAKKINTGGTWYFMHSAVPSEGGDPAPIEFTPSVTKAIETAEGVTAPEETFTFTLAAGNTADPMPEAGGETATITGEGTASFGKITFSKAGEYTYTVKETKGSTPGYTYDSTEYTMTVTVTVENGALVAEAVLTAAGVEKTELKFINKYEAGSLKVTKTVAGNAADTSKEFDFGVLLDPAVSGTFGDMTFNASGYAEFTLKDGGSKTATNLPAGISYSVTEKSDGYEMSKTNDEGTIKAMQGFLDCYEGSKLMGTVCSAGVYEKGEIKATKYLDAAYQLGLKVR